MRFVKASDFDFQDRQIYFGRRIFTDELGEKIVKGSGRLSDGAFFWKGLNEPPVMERHFSELEILDESLPASVEQEAEKLYPYPKGRDREMPYDEHQIADLQREAWVDTCRMYLDTIEKLKAEVESLRKLLPKEYQNILNKHDKTNNP